MARERSSLARGIWCAFLVIAVFIMVWTGVGAAILQDSDDMRTARSSFRSLSQTADEPKKTKDINLAVAVIVPYGVVNHAAAWQDAFAVLGQSARAALAQSQRVSKVSYIALVPDDVASEPAEHAAELDALARLGWDAYFVRIPVHLAEVSNPFGREPLSKVLGEKEQLKYYGAALTEFDRVLVLDGDVILVQSFDELFDLSVTPGLVGTYDHEMDIAISTFPPVNSGFLLFTPSMRDFDGLAEVYREGDLTDRGFRGSGTGWTYGAGSQGILSFFYNQWIPHAPGVNFSLRPTKGKDLPGMVQTVQPTGSRFHPLDRSVYGVIQTKDMMEAFASGGATIDRVKSFHFAGGCGKPWTCQPPSTPVCEAMTAKWWETRRGVEAFHGLPRSDRCKGWGKYDPMFLLSKTNKPNDQVAPSV
eukprot:TRINITY_DN23218_c0_g1_i1.p1 TRINITY_DN23218_c0_g1~~TRINITY_DN23218_c0_g1_i1.p1  ORF type:complete len:439 (-),score=47.45 TRINITY_DN23218_c0_g1_i1:30-1283(-)